MEAQRRETGLDLEAFLNPKSRMSGPAALFHMLWLKRWKLLAIWIVLAIPICTILALYDIPRTYDSVAYLRFPQVTGGNDGPVRDVSLGEAESVVRLFNSRKVLLQTIEEMGLRMEVSTKEVYRKYVIERIEYGDGTPAGRYRLEFPGNRRVRVSYRPWGERRFRLFADTVADAANSAPIPGGRITFPSALLDVSRGFQVEMIFRTPDEALADFGDRLKVTPLDKGQTAVNYAVALEDRDPFLVADVVNRLTRNFIRIYTGANNSQDRDVLARMQDNMAAAREALDKAQDKLAAFYSRNEGRLGDKTGNPYVLANAQTRKDKIESDLERLAQTLADKPGPAADSETRTLWVNEALALMSGQGVQKAEALRARVEALERKKAELTVQYNPAHPLVAAVDGELEALYPSVASLAEDTRARARARLAAAEGEISRTLPGGGNMKIAVEARQLAEERDNAAKALEDLRAEYDRAKLGAGPSLFEVNVMDSARPPLYIPPTLRSRLIVAGAAGCAAFFPGLAWMLLAQLLFPRVWNKDDAERMLKAKVAGSLYHIGGRSARRAPSKSAGGRPIDDCLLHHGRYSGASDVEAYRALRVELEHLFSGPPGRGAMSLLVTSTEPGEGKSTVAANLAIGWARRGRRTLLIDADFRHGRQARAFGFAPQRGLIDLLRAGVDPDFARRARSLELPTVQAGLFLMPKGHYDESATEAAYRAPLELYLKMMHASFEVILIDGPPVIVTADPINIASLCNGVIHVMRSGQVPAREAVRALEPFRERNIPLAVVINGIRRSPADENYYARYGYYYQVDELPSVAAAGSETRIGT